MKENSNIVLVEKNQEQVGKILRWSKQKYSWTYQLDGIFKEIKFYNSVNSGKKLILLDGNVIYEDKMLIIQFLQCLKRNTSKPFFYEFTWENYEFTLEQNSNKSFDLLVKSLIVPLNKCSKFNYYIEEQLGDETESLESHKLFQQQVVQNQYQQQEEGEELKIKLNILNDQKPTQQFCSFNSNKVPEKTEEKMKINQQVLPQTINQLLSQKENTQLKQISQPNHQRDLLEMTEGTCYTPQDKLLKMYEDEAKQQQILKEKEANKDRFSVLNFIQYPTMNNQREYQQNYYPYNQNNMHWQMQQYQPCQFR